MRPYHKAKSQKHRWQGVVVMLGIIALFLGFAAALTLLAPTYVLDLRRGETGVTARLEQRMLWWIPIHRQTLEHLAAVKMTILSAPAQQELDENSHQHWVTPEAEGYLVLTHAGGETRMRVSTVNLPDAERQVTAFLRGGPSEYHLWSVASWTAGAIAPGILAAIAGLIVALTLVDTVCRIFSIPARKPNAWDLQRQRKNEEKWSQ